jgi:uncharacterized integral membrane protein
MKFFSLSVAILFSFLVLILAFENLGAKTTYFLLLFISADSIPAFFITLILALLGAITGVFYTLFFMEAVREKSDNGSNESEPE